MESPAPLREQQLHPLYNRNWLLRTRAKLISWFTGKTTEAAVPLPKKSSVASALDELTIKEARDSRVAAAPPSLQDHIIESGITREYGEHSWRPLQTLIDILQNHLDSTSHQLESAVWSLLNCGPYDPSDKLQAELATHLIMYKRMTDPHSQKYDRTQCEISLLLLLYAYKQSVSNGERTGPVPATIPPDELRKALEGIPSFLPQIRIRLRRPLSDNHTDGKQAFETKVVLYDKLRSCSPDWEITGFRVVDHGLGFDKQLLGSMGTTTKQDLPTRRGGLGEGLKMSIAHLIRLGARVRVRSHNADETWLTTGNIKDNQVVFEGQHIPSKRRTGSITDVDFSSVDDDNDPRITELLDALDTRKGPGLAEHILDFSENPEIANIGYENAELTQCGIPGGKVYVRGLEVVSHRQDLIFSYNLKDKFAIAGRDRKTVNADVLVKVVIDFLKFRATEEHRKLMVEKMTKSASYYEISILNDILENAGELGSSGEDKWRDSITTVLNVDPHTTVLAPPGIHPDDMRFAESRGMRVFIWHSEAVKNILVHFFPEMKSLQDFKTLQQESSQKPSEAPVSKELVLALKAKAALLLKKINTAQQQNVVNRYFPAQYQLLNVQIKSLFPGLALLDDMEVARISTDIFLSKEFDTQNLKDILDYLLALVGILPDWGVTINFDLFFQDVLTSLCGMLFSLEHKKQLRSFSGLPESSPLSLHELTYNETQQQLDQLDEKIAESVAQFTDPNIHAYSLLKPIAEQIKSLLAIRKDLSNKLNVRGRKKFLYEHGESIKIQGIERAVRTRPLRDGNAVVFQKNGEEIRGKIIGALQLTSDQSDHSEALLTQSSFVAHEPGESWLQLTIPEGESRIITFTNPEKASPVHYKVTRKHNKLTVSIAWDSSKDWSFRPPDMELFVFLHTYVQFYNGFMRWQHSAGDEVLIESIDQESAVLPEKNEGLPFLATRINVNYGQSVWNDPQRLLLDAIQNHVDADPDHQPTVQLVYVNTEGKLLSLSIGSESPDTAGWLPIGISIADKGTGYSTNHLQLLGTSTKHDDSAAIGKFGEGLKMLAASSVRQGLACIFSSREWGAAATEYQENFKDYERDRMETQTMLGFSLVWSTVPREGSRTYFGLVAIDEGQNQLSAAQLDYVNSLWQRDSTVMSAWQKVVGVIHSSSHEPKLLLPDSEPKVTNKKGSSTELLPGKPGVIYENGLLIGSSSSLSSPPPLLFGYNLSKSITNTRERNNISVNLLRDELAGFFYELTDPTIIKKILRAAKENRYYFELDVLSGLLHQDIPLATLAAWRKAYYELFPKDSALSLMPAINSGLLSNLQFDVAYTESQTVPGQLVTLQAYASKFLYNIVYSSEDLDADLSSKEVILANDEFEQLLDYLRRINAGVISKLEQYSQLPASQAFFDQIGGETDFRARIEDLRNMQPHHIHITHESAAHNGLASIGKLKITLSRRILKDPTQVLATYLHELAHFLSGESDFRINFERMLALIGLPMEAIVGN